MYAEGRGDSVCCLSISAKGRYRLVDWREMGVVPSSAAIRVARVWLSLERRAEAVGLHDRDKGKNPSTLVLKSSAANDNLYMIDTCGAR